jgi:hypothetical protein
METLWNISGTVAYKNGRVEEIGAIKDFGGINATRCNYTSGSITVKNIGSNKLIYFLGLTPDPSQVLISSVTPLSDYFGQY